MNTYLPFVYDGLILLMFALYISRGMRQGFVRAVGELLSWFAAVAIGVLGSAAISPIIYNTAIRGTVVNMTENAVSNIVAQGSMAPESIIVQVEEMIENLPMIVRGMINVDLASVQTELSRIINLQADDIATAIADTIIGPIIITVLQFITFFAIFTIAIFVMGLLCRALNVFNHVPVIGPLNSVFGATFGALQSLVVISVVAVLVQMFIAATDSSVAFLNISLVRDTYILKFFMENNLVLLGFGFFA